MGVIHEELHTTSKMEGNNACHINGEKTLSVSTFVQIIKGLRIKSKENKNFGCKMLPVVRLEYMSQTQIDKITGRITIQKSATVHKNRIFSSSSSEETDDPKPSVSSTSRVVASPTYSSRISSFSDESDSEETSEEDYALPDLSDAIDPTYADKGQKFPKNKNFSEVYRAENKEKMKRRKSKVNFFKASDGKLMKAAKQTCLAKQKMFAISAKDKRVLKSEKKGDKNLKSLEHQTKPSIPGHPYKTTGLVELKPYARSPKDVEQRTKTSSNMMNCDDSLNDENISSIREQETDKQNELRLLFQNRLNSPPPAFPLQESNLRKGYISEKENDSDDTVIYENTTCTDTVLPGRLPVRLPTHSDRKRKKSVETGSRNDLEGCSEIFHSTVASSPSKSKLMVVPSPIPYGVESLMDEEAIGGQQIKIKEIEGGVAFDLPEASPSAYESCKLKLLKEKNDKKSILEKQLISVRKIHEELLRKAKAAYERQISREKKRYQKEVDIIGKEKQKLDAEITSILNGEEDKIDPVESDATEVSSFSSGAPIPDEDAPNQEMVSSSGTKPGSKRAKLNIISDASINKFGTIKNVQSTASRIGSENTNPAQVGTKLTSADRPRQHERGRSRKSMPELPLAMVFLPDGSIHPRKNPAEAHAESTMVSINDNPQLSSSTSSIIPSPMLLPQSQTGTVQAVSTSQPQILVHLPPSFQPGNQGQIQSQGPLQMPPGFQTSSSGLIFVPSQEVIPTSGPVIANSMNRGISDIPTSRPLVNVRNPVIPESQRSFIKQSVSTTKSYSGTNNPLSLQRQKQCSSGSQAGSYSSITTEAKRAMNQPKSHLLVAAQPSSLKSGSITQAKLPPTNSIGIVTGEISKSNIFPKAHLSQSNYEEGSSSPEAEHFCFLCGSPGKFVCCNSIVYCSEDCKKKDWSRHCAEHYGESDNNTKN